MGFQITRRANATWAGSDSTGTGEISLGSGSFTGPYSLKSRVEKVPQANPEELIGAALAACFTMSLSNKLTAAGFAIAALETSAKVRMAEEEGRYSITDIQLTLSGTVPGIDIQEFERIAREAEATCPVSRALAGTRIDLAIADVIVS
jgi:osmotically inducible protein OsmC